MQASLFPLLPGNSLGADAEKLGRSVEQQRVALPGALTLKRRQSRPERNIGGGGLFKGVGKSRKGRKKDADFRSTGLEGDGG
jgi:hypothetical protein